MGTVDGSEIWLSNQNVEPQKQGEIVTQINQNDVASDELVTCMATKIFKQFICPFLYLFTGMYLLV